MTLPVIVERSWRSHVLAAACMLPLLFASSAFGLLAPWSNEASGALLWSAALLTCLLVW
jgi:hypothetical protein